MFNLGFYSGRKAPAIRLAPTLLDRVMELVALLLLIAAWVLILIPYFRGKIENDNWLISMIVSTGIFAWVAWTGYMPVRYINFPVRVHEGNVVIQYLYATRFGRVLNIILQLCCVSSVLYFAGGYYGVSYETVKWIFLAVAGLFLGTMIVYYIWALQRR
ncbi:MAG: hypothetical protein LIP08_05875 [Bacteroides sp.]|nr:hypothetical protein [Bacteroides sp.]